MIATDDFSKVFETESVKTLDWNFQGLRGSKMRVVDDSLKSDWTDTTKLTLI